MTDEFKQQRFRFSKEIAEELIATHGAFAHLAALEKLDGSTGTLWRDVLAWLDELTGEKKCTDSTTND